MPCPSHPLAATIVIRERQIRRTSIKVQTDEKEEGCISNWWPETGSFFPRVLVFCKLQKTQCLKIRKLHLSRLGGTKLVQSEVPVYT
jgi:hypothetical protein